MSEFCNGKIFRKKKKRAKLKEKMKSLKGHLNMLEPNSTQLYPKLKKKHNLYLPQTKDNWKYPIPPSLENEQFFLFKEVKAFQDETVFLTPQS